MVRLFCMIAIGLYDSASGQRLIATDLNDLPLPDNVVRLGDFTSDANADCR